MRDRPLGLGLGLGLWGLRPAIAAETFSLSSPALQPSRQAPEPEVTCLPALASGVFWSLGGMRRISPLAGDSSGPIGRRRSPPPTSRRSLTSDRPDPKKTVAKVLALAHVFFKSARIVSILEAGCPGCRRPRAVGYGLWLAVGSGGRGLVLRASWRCFHLSRESGRRILLSAQL